MPQEAPASHAQQLGHSQAAADTTKAAKGIPHMMSEASVMSAESDDDANDLTGKSPRLEDSSRQDSTRHVKSSPLYM